MKTLDSKQTSLDACLDEVKSDRLVITRDGKPVALVVSVEGLDAEQIETGGNDQFWQLIRARRGQKSLTRAELEQALGQSDSQ